MYVGDTRRRAPYRGACGGDTRIITHGLHHGGLSLEERGRSVSIELRVVRRGGERNVGMVVCGVHNELRGRRWIHFIKESTVLYVSKTRVVHWRRQEESF